MTTDTNSWIHIFEKRSLTYATQHILPFASFVFPIKSHTSPHMRRDAAPNYSCPALEHQNGLSTKRKNYPSTSQNLLFLLQKQNSSIIEK